MQGNYSKATAIVTSARAQYVEIGSRMGDADCSACLGAILFDQRNYAEAESLLLHAFNVFLDIRDQDDWTAY